MKVKTIWTLNELLKSYPTYQEGAKEIQEKVKSGQLIPIKSSKTNGKIPPLFNKYRKSSFSKKEESRDWKEFLDSFPVSFDPNWYAKHPAQLKKDAWIIQKLIEYLETDPDLSLSISENERSFEIWHQEKLLTQSGSRVITNLGLPDSFLNTYKTHEPICFFSATNRPGFLLIMENLDPFIACRQWLEDNQKDGTIIYGAGKKIVRNLEDLQTTSILFLKQSLPHLFYLGDLDWEGIAIYDSLCQHYPTLSIPILVRGYRLMLQKAHAFWNQLPVMKEGQEPREDSFFFTFFEDQEVQEMKILLKSGHYIPQEILISSDYAFLLKTLSKEKGEKE